MNSIGSARFGQSFIRQNLTFIHPNVAAWFEDLIRRTLTFPVLFSGPVHRETIDICRMVARKPPKSDILQQKSPAEFFADNKNIAGFDNVPRGLSLLFLIWYCAA